MQVLFIVLNKTECLEQILQEFGKNNIVGATILDSKGMVQALSEHDELKFIGSLRDLLEPAHTENKTIFMVVSEEQIPVVSKIVNRITGGLDKPDTGILFTLPVHYMEGLKNA